MGEWIVSCSILILCVIAIRFLFRGKIILRLQYALWGLVLLRLLLPVSFGSSTASTANIPAAVERQPAVQSVIELGQLRVPMQSYEEAYEQVVQRYEAQGLDVSSFQGAELEALEYEAYEQMRGETAAQILKKAAVWVWLAGMAVVTAVFLISNLHFRRELWRSRIKLEYAGSTLPVYRVDGLDTPCLFGIANPAIYITPEVAEAPVILRHAITHETTHYRHGDHVWAVLRAVCIAVHWYNPLVWWAAFLSQRDGELACDEAVIRELGESERAAYGRTLIGLTCQKKSNMLLSATTMTASGSGIRERIRLIARKPKMAVCTLTIVALLTLTVVGCTFSGPTAYEDTLPSETEPTETTYTPNSLTGTVGGLPHDAVMVCNAADLEGKNISYISYVDIRENLNNYAFRRELEDILHQAAAGTEQLVLSGAEGCYISVKKLSAFQIHQQTYSSGFICYLFTEAIEPAGEILFYMRDGQLQYNHPVLYGLRSSYGYLHYMREAPEREHILLSNGYLNMLLDEDNKIHYSNTQNQFKVEGDYFHGLDWQAMALSYNAITDPDNLIWISLVTTEMIHEAVQRGIDTLIPYLPYVDGADYERTYGPEGVFELLDMVKQWVQQEPSYHRMETAMTQIRFVDGAYADYYAIMLTDLFEENKPLFAKLCLKDLPQEDARLILSLVAYDWAISVEEAQARLEAALG